MTKIRTVKPDLFRHELLFDAEQKTKLPLRLAFISLFTCCDREGRFRWNPRLLKLDMLPYDDINVSEVLDALSHYGFVIKYCVNNEVYGYIPSWKKHQRINLREPESFIPCVTEGIVISTARFHSEEQFSSSIHFSRDQNNAMHGMCTHVPDKTIAFTDIPQLKISTTEQNIHDKKNDGAQRSDFEKNTTENFQNLPLNSAKKLQNYQQITDPLANYGPPSLGSAEIDPNDIFFVPHNTARACTWGSGREVEMEVEQEREMEGEVEQEVEGDCQGETELTTALVKTKPLRDVSNDQVQEVFAHWKTAMSHPNAKLDDKRKTIIRKALKFGYSVTQLCEAISGCALTPHNVGINDRGQRYDGLHVILRDADQIDRFIHNHHQPPQMLNVAQKREQSNITTLQNWANKKLHNLYEGQVV